MKDSSLVQRLFYEVLAADIKKEHILFFNNIYVYTRLGIDGRYRDVSLKFKFRRNYS